MSATRLRPSSERISRQSASVSIKKFSVIMAEQIKMRLFVRVAVRRVHTHPLFGKCTGGFFVKDRRIVIRFRFSDGCPRFPSRAASGVGMNRDEQTIFRADLCGDLVHTAGAFRQRNIVDFGNDRHAVGPACGQRLMHSSGDVPVKFVFEELFPVGPYGRAFSGRGAAMPVVDQDFHFVSLFLGCCRLALFFTSLYWSNSSVIFLGSLALANNSTIVVISTAEDFIALRFSRTERYSV